jgi:hypothetical protein
MQALRRLAFVAAASGLVCLAHLAAADSITLKSGETLVGKVRSFEANHSASHSSRFVIEVDDETRIIPLHKIDAITFDGAASGGQKAASPPPPASARLGRDPQAAAAVAPSGSAEASGEHWLTTSSHKRHNSSCKYYKSSKGRPCGPNEGTPCKMCGG